MIGMKLVKFSKLAILAGLTAMFALILGACGGDDPTVAAPAATATPVPVEKPTLIFADLNWDSAQIQNGIVRAIAERGYGYETDAVPGGTIPLMQALVAGDVNINMELWLPNQQDSWDEASKSGELKIIGNSLEDNWQSSYLIPTYTAEANPGLKSVTDLPDYVDLFKTTATGDKGRNIGCIPGWECEVINEKKIIAYGLDDTYELVNPGSIAALDALPPIVEAVGDKMPVLFDSGIRHGADIMKSIALGARAVLLGRPYSWVLAVGGEDGVRQVLEFLLADYDINMAQSGLTTTAQLGPDILRRADE